MAPSADLRSFDALPALSAALGRFAEHGRASLDACNDAAERALEELEDEVSARERRLRSLEREAAARDADDEDGAGSMAAEIEEAERELRSIRAAVDEVESHLAAYRRAADRAQELFAAGTPRAQAFLERKQGEAGAYVALSPPGHSAAVRLNQRGVAIPLADSGRAGGVLPTAVLPPGFRWIAVAEVDSPRLDDAAFHKVAPGEVERGYRELAGRIVPALARTGPDEVRDELARLDAAEGRGGADGIEKVYDAFFGDDAIYLSRRAGDARWTVTNGQHRLEIARRLGITHVPARTAGAGPTP